MLIMLALSPLCANCQTTQGISPNEISNQQTVRRFEAGGQWSVIGFETCTNAITCPTPPRLAAGPSFTVNLNQHWAIDARLSETLVNDGQPTAYVDGSIAGGRGLNLMVGPRLTTRAGRWGMFLGADVGFLSWSHVAKNLIVTPVPGGVGEVTFVYGRDVFFAGEPSLGVEYAVCQRARLRVQVGDELIHYGQAEFPGETASTPFPNAWTSNATLTTSILWGIGPAARGHSGSFDRYPEHRFFDKANVTLLGISLLGQAADAVTTQRFLHHGGLEANALSRPFVNQGWPGQIGLAVITNGAQIGIMYGLHKMGHHRWERVIPVAYTAASSYAGYYNLQ